MYHNDSDSVYAVFSGVVRFHYYRMHMLLEKFGVYPGQHKLFFVLGKQGGLSQKELAEKLNIKAATITVMLNRMEKAKLIERRQDQSDQRVTRVYLTEQGRKILDQVKESLKTIDSECFHNFTTEEQVLLRSLLIKMRDNLKKVCEKNSDE
jgi:MarR family transcriptional regulator, organic hydroperoxide resistance regulator